jgi:hypothetical protein
MGNSVYIDNSSVRASIERIQREYSYLSESAINTAISRALNRTVSQGRTATNRDIRKTYNVSASRINNEIKTRNSSTTNLEAMVVASGAPLSMNNFQAKEDKPKGTTSFNRKGVASSRLNRRAKSNAVKGVTMTIRKGKTMNLPTAFIQLSNGGITVFARGVYKGTSEGFEFGKARLPIGKITTLSIPMMMANDTVLKPVSRELEEVFDRRITHEVGRLLSM